MGKPKKNKQHKNHQPISVKPQIQPPRQLNDDDKLDIEIKNEETEKEFSEKKLKANEELSQKSQDELNKALEKEDLKKYWDYVQEINKRLEKLIENNEKEKERIEIKLKSFIDANDEEKENLKKIKEDILEKKNQLEIEKSDFKKQVQELNKKEKEITERELAIDNGDYTTVIRNAIVALQKTRDNIFTETEKLTTDLASFHKENLEKLASEAKDLIRYKSEAASLEREKKKFEVDKKIFEEDIREQLETEYSVKIDEQAGELKIINKKFDKLQGEYNRQKNLTENLLHVFNSLEPGEILTEHQKILDENNSLKSELNDRPEKADYDRKTEQLSFLETKLRDLQQKINENEFLNLKQIFDSQDSYIVEINALKNTVESAKARESSLTKTINDLKGTITQLKGEVDQKAVAFEFATRYDADSANYGKNHIEPASNPENLHDLCIYLRNKIANNGFFYELDTIRIFLSGLYMAPITILQGLSGTGKTSLPREFSTALLSHDQYKKTIDNEKQAPFRIISVQSGWRDNMDLMGYYNSFERRYKETEFFKALYVSNLPKYRDTLFLIILDEMNLSRPEYYFADFLSLLEQKSKYINISNTPEEFMPALIKGGKLRVPPNVRFIGTANHDETTLEFAPKTYDRSNVIELPKIYDASLKEKSADENYSVSYKWLVKNFKEAENKNKDQYAEKFSQFIKSDNLKYLLGEKGIGIGNRFKDHSEKFIGVFLETGNNKDKDISIAADHLITSRLFRQIKNRYELDKQNLIRFKDDYIKEFIKNFNHKPEMAITLFEEEIGKKS